MLISIIMPVYNAEKYLKDAIDSVLRQTFKDFELIIVNDGSTDNSLEIIKNYGKKIHLINQNNSGAAVARNTGIKSANGEYIFFMDADDTIKENALLKMEDYLKNDIDLLIGLYSMYNADKNILIFEKDSDIKEELINGKSCKEVVQVLNKYRLSSSPWRYFIKRNLIINNNLFFNANSLVEDAIWVPKLLCSAKSFMLNEEPFYNYNIHSNSVSTAKKFKFYEDAMKGCNDLYNFSLHVETYKKSLVYSYYMMLLVGIMQDYDFFSSYEKEIINKWFIDNKKVIKTCIKAIKPLQVIGVIIGNKNVLYLLGKYLKRKNTVN